MEKLIQELAKKSEVDEDTARRVLSVLGVESVDKKLKSITGSSGLERVALGDLKLGVRLTANDAIV